MRIPSYKKGATYFLKRGVNTCVGWPWREGYCKQFVVGWYKETHHLPSPLVTSIYDRLISSPSWWNWCKFFYLILVFIFYWIQNSHIDLIIRINNGIPLTFVSLLFYFLSIILKHRIINYDKLNPPPPPRPCRFLPMIGLID